MAKKRPDIKDNLEIRAIESDNILLKFKEVTAKEVSLETCFEDALLLYNLFYKVVPNTRIVSEYIEESMFTFFLFL